MSPSPSSSDAPASDTPRRTRSARSSDELLEDLRAGRPMRAGDRASLVWRLSLPTILAEISFILMEYIDAAMVGRIGSDGAAAIGLVASTTWLFWGGMRAAATGFTVQVAQAIGASRPDQARTVLRQGIMCSLAWAAALGCLGVAIASPLPRWLGGVPAIRADASRYFLVFMLSLPIAQMRVLSSGMLQASGDMRTSGALNVLSCVLDILFNFFFIFPSRTVAWGGLSLTLPGAGLGVTGAALGTVAADAATSTLMCWALLARSPALRLRAGEAWRLSRDVLRRAVRIGAPIGFESAVMTGAMVAATRIVAPLGSIALAANSFAITAESLCYMPGYGIGSAATTLVGQSVGARRPALARQLAWLCTGAGMLVMALLGALLWAFAPQMMALLTPDAAVQTSGVRVLRVELFAEPLFAASIVASGALRGAGDTLVPSLLNFASMWGVRIPLAAWLVVRHGLLGAWIAMAVELCVRGLLMLGRLTTLGREAGPKSEVQSPESEVRGEWCPGNRSEI